VIVFRDAFAGRPRSVDRHALGILDWHTPPNVAIHLDITLMETGEVFAPQPAGTFTGAPVLRTGGGFQVATIVSYDTPTSAPGPTLTPVASCDPEPGEAWRFTHFPAPLPPAQVQPGVDVDLRVDSGTVHGTIASLGTSFYPDASHPLPAFFVLADTSVVLRICRGAAVVLRSDPQVLVGMVLQETPEEHGRIVACYPAHRL
jgi:hypothetical protein